MSEALTAKMGSLFIQFTPGKKPEYVGGCVDADALTEPQADRTPIICRDANGNPVSRGSVRGVPGAPTTSLTALEFPEQGVLDLVGLCDLTLYFLSDPCAKLGIFQSYMRGRILWGAGLTSIAEENIVKRQDNTETTMKLDFTGQIPVYRVRPLTVVRQDIAETTDLLAVTFCNQARCAGDCGDAQELCEDGYIGGASPAGSPAAFADVWETSNGGGTWANAGGHAFAAGENITALVCFPIDRNSTRLLAFREADPAAPLECAYSDNGGTTWTNVTIGATNNEGVIKAQAVKAFDSAHIWVATDAGNIYFSDDGGLTWTDQGALTPSGGSPLEAIDFSDFSNGYAVGDSGAIIRTTDGGDTWSDSPCDDPSGGDDLLSLQVFSGYRLEVGTGTGELYQSWDAGATWEAKTYNGQAATDEITDLEFANDYCGFMLVHPTAGQDYVHKTIDGGHTWERLTTPTNAGLKDVWVCDCNNSFVVGAASGGTGVVLKVG